MLGNLDNEVIFKKAFTNKVVFKAFVKDILELDVEVDKIETEKKFEPKIGYVDFELDIFAETVDKRIVIEIQRVAYDHNFDRFLHYFLMVIAEQQKKSVSYGIQQTVYLIVILTAPFAISEKNGKPVRDEVLLLNLNPKTLGGIERDLYGHQFCILNPNHQDNTTPKRIRDWLDLIYQSIHTPERPTLNTDNEGIKQVIEIIDFDNLTPQERADAKMSVMYQETKAIYESKAREEGREEGREEEKITIVRKAIEAGLNDEMIAQLTGFDVAQIHKIRKE